MNGAIARPIALSMLLGNGWTGLGSGGIRAAKANAPAVDVPHRISRRQLDQIATQLTDSDLAVLRFLSELRLATGHQLARRLWSARTARTPEARSARRALRRLESWRIIDRLPRRIGGVRAGSASIVYFVGPAGRRLLARDGFEAKRHGFPGQRMATHTLAITELVVRLHEASHVSGELDLIDHQTEPRCWRSFLGLMGRRYTLKPDLFVRIGAGAFEDRWFIEIDLATESSPTILAQAKRYIAYLRSGEEQRRYGVFPRVIWTVPDERRRSQIASVIAQLPQAAQRLFVVWDYEEVIGRLAAEATP